MASSADSCLGCHLRHGSVVGESSPRCSMYLENEGRSKLVNDISPLVSVADARRRDYFRKCAIGHLAVVVAVEADYCRYIELSLVTLTVRLTIE
jgi:hypothetical protein